MAHKARSGNSRKPDKPKIDWKALDIVHPDAAGIDIGGGEHGVAISPDRTRSRYDALTVSPRICNEWRTG